MKQDNKQDQHRYSYNKNLKNSTKPDHTELQNNTDNQTR